VERLVRSIIKDAADDPFHPLTSSAEELEAARRAAQAVTPEEGTWPKS
jgi:hypothetical protein